MIGVFQRDRSISGILSQALSVLTLGEIAKGIALRARRDAHGAASLQEWLDGLRLLFAERILAIDDAVATRWGRLAGDTSLPAIDGLIAATALVHDLTVVTRNTSDFAPVRSPADRPLAHLRHVALRNLG